MCDFQRFSLERPKDIKESITSTVYSARDAVRAIMFPGGPFITSAWGKLYHRRLFQTLRFPKGMVYEDLPVVWKTIVQVDKIVFTPTVKYYYRQNPTSITNTRYTPKTLDHIKAHQMLLDELPQWFPDLTSIIRGRLGCYAAIYLYGGLKSSSFLDYEASKMLQQNTKKHLLCLLRNKFPHRVKLFALLVSNDFIFDLLYKRNR